MRLEKKSMNSLNSSTRYVTANPHHLDAQNLAAVQQWKQFIKGDFFLERYLKKHAVFIGDDIVYGVCALNDGFDDFFPKNCLPIYVKTVLLPFQGRIIYDGLLHSYNVGIGGGIKRSLKEMYMRAKQNSAIITSLDDQGADQEQAEILLTKDWSAEIEQLSAVAKTLRGGKGQPAVHSPVFSLIKASVALMDKALANPSDVEMLLKELDKVERTLAKIEDTLYRMDY